MTRFPAKPDPPNALLGGAYERKTMLSRKERRRLAKERGEDWKTSELNERPVTERRMIQSAKERERRAKARRADQRAVQAITAMQIAYLLGEH
jgi:hypothetical protein